MLLISNCLGMRGPHSALGMNVQKRNESNLIHDDDDNDVCQSFIRSTDPLVNWTALPSAI